MNNITNLSPKISCINANYQLSKEKEKSAEGHHSHSKGNNKEEKVEDTGEVKENENEHLGSELNSNHYGSNNLQISKQENFNVKLNQTLQSKLL